MPVLKEWNGAAWVPVGTADTTPVSELGDSHLWFELDDALAIPHGTSPAITGLSSNAAVGDDLALDESGTTVTFNTAGTYRVAAQVTFSGAGADHAAVSLDWSPNPHSGRGSRDWGDPMFINPRGNSYYDSIFYVAAGTTLDFIGTVFGSLDASLDFMGVEIQRISAGAIMPTEAPPSAQWSAVCLIHNTAIYAFAPLAPASSGSSSFGSITTPIKGGKTVSLDGNNFPTGVAVTWANITLTKLVDDAGVYLDSPPAQSYTWSGGEYGAGSSVRFDGVAADNADYTYDAETGYITVVNDGIYYINFEIDA